MKTTRKIISILLTAVLLCTAAFGADFTYAPKKLFTAEEIAAMFTKLLKSNDLRQVSANEGEVDLSEDGGFVYISADAFALGGGYVMEPAKIEIHDGDTAASVLIRALALNDLVGDYDGDERNDFYLHSIGGVNFEISMEPALTEWLEDIVDYCEPEQWSGGVLGEFDITNMSGWLYWINGETATEGMSDCYVSAGDVINLRFSLAYGMDIGAPAFGDVDEPYTEAVDLSAVTKSIAEGEADSESCEKVMNKASLSQEEVDELLQNN